MGPPSLGNLLDRWEQAHLQGKDISPEQPCPDCPERANDLARVIAALGPVRQPPDAPPTFLDKPASRLPGRAAEPEHVSPTACTLPGRAAAPRAPIPLAPGQAHPPPPPTHIEEP